MPDNQFSFFLAYNYFNYRPFEIIQQYLIEIYQKLRPGGVLAMTFNDCDRQSALLAVNQSFASYTPGHVIFNMAKTIGYKQIFQWNDTGPTTWIELQKPGNLSSTKGGQPMAKINHK